MTPENRLSLDSTAFLVCGLGGLGQYCAIVLKEFGVKVHAIDLVDKGYWEIPDLAAAIDCLVIGDCCQPKILEQAKIQQCRAILLVASNERVNIQAAFVARAANPDVRLIIRSDQQNLNQLLAQRLGNFVAFEATQLPAAAFALAALGGETRGFFNLENQLLRVVRVQIDRYHRWCDRPQLQELNTSTRRILAHTRSADTPAKGFHQWEPDARIREGDTVVYIEAIAEKMIPGMQPSQRRSRMKEWRDRLNWRTLKPFLQQSWADIQQTPTQQVALLSGITMFGLFLLGALLYKLQYPDLNLQDALNVSLVLILGGYDNLFGQLRLSFPVPVWLHLFSVGLTVIGTVFVGILYALLTERVLVSRFQFLKRRPPVPKADHVVLVGFGRVGQRVAKLLQDLKQPLLGIHSAALETSVLPQMPLIVGNLTTTLNRANLTTAKSIIAVTDDEVTNLEIGLMAYAANPTLNLVIRTFDPLFSDNVARLLPHARVLGAYALAAEAFVAAAFGENVINLFRLNNQTMLVTEYRVEADDTLTGLLLAEVAYGYEVVPILHQKRMQEFAKLMPDDTRLEAGDRLIILATLDGLQRIERRALKPRQWFVQVEKAFSSEAVFDGGAAIARISGCEIGLARSRMSHLPGLFDYPLYKHQAQRLVSELSKAQVLAHLVYTEENPD
ncbi:NAD-binding protein [Phormidesmis priestleyi]